jgi:hypothetical protein
MPSTVHKTKSTACGGARRGHAVAASWAEVTCVDCLKHMPGLPASPCGHCRRPLLGRCVRLPGVEFNLHENCVRAFELSAEGRALLLQASRTRGASCSSCGQPLAKHADGKACPSVLGGMKRGR